VLRVAMSEIEDYSRVRLLSVDEALVGNQSAVDLAHLLSELMENAAGFSPPNTSVEVKGIQEPDGYYLISVTDFGIGMSEEQLSAANIILANPPELGLGLSRSLGFIVVGRLARRLGVRVELTRGTTSMGVTALVLVPASVLAGDHTTATPVGAAPAPVTPAPLEPLAYESFAHETAAHEPAAHQSHVHAVPPALQGPSRPVASPFADPISPAPSFGATTPFEPGFFGTPAFDAPPPPSDAPMNPGFDDPAIDAPWPPKPAIEPATPIEYQSEALAELLGKAPTPRPSHTPGDTPDSFTPASLAQAIPDGDRFEAGVAALLQPGHPASYRPAPPSTTDSGLVKRDRSRSQAPPSEGRTVAPSVRSPEEIRQMLARYRDGRSRPLDDADGSRSSDRAVSPDPFNPGGHA
jgi:anti-sigma regulatory factor (Ser/Thr protein kinase)